MTDNELKDLITSLALKSDRLDALAAQNSSDIKALVAQTAAQAKAQSLADQARSAAADERSAKADARFDKLAAKYGGLSDNLGSAAEEFFLNSLEDSPTVGGIRFDEVYSKVFGGKMGKQSEYDIVLVNGAAAAIVEVKYKVHPSALDQLEAQLAKYKEHFPEHKNFALYGGIAGMSIPDEVVSQAKARGMFVLKCKGELLQTDSSAMRAF